MHPFPERHSQFLLLRAWTSWTWRSVVGPLFDSAYDWNHYGGPVFDVVGKRLLSIILQHILHHGQKQPAAVPSPPQPAPSLLSNALPVQQQSYAPPQQQAGGVVAAPPMQEERRPGCPGMNASQKNSTSFSPQPTNRARNAILETSRREQRHSSSGNRGGYDGGSWNAFLVWRLQCRESLVVLGVVRPLTQGEVTRQSDFLLEPRDRRYHYSWLLASIATVGGWGGD